MRYVIFPFYFFLVLMVLLWSSLRQAWYQIPPVGPIILSILFLIFVLFSLGQPPYLKYLLPGLDQPIVSPPLAPAITPGAKQLYQTHVATWLELAKKQPTHRDVLINISRLYQALGQPLEAQEYWSQAQKLDPNNATFQN